MNDDIFFGPSSKKTYAALSPTDLETMGKIAANKYLNGEMSLNDAIVKLSREQPSISNHQVRRVVEFANQETFARLFEKNASDKNIEFPLAQPGHVLQALNDSAKPGTLFTTSEEYESSPVKQAHSEVEMDLEVARMFGLDLSTPEAEKTASAEMEKTADEATDRIMAMKENSALPQEGTPLSAALGPSTDSRQMSQDEEAMKTSGPMEDRLAIMGAPQPQAQAPQQQQADQAQQLAQSQGQIEQSEAMPGEVQQGAVDGQQPTSQAPEAAMATDGSGEGHQQRMLGLQREIEYAKKREELAKIQQKMVAAMQPQPPPGMEGTPGDPNQIAQSQQQYAQMQQGGQAQDPNARAQDPNAQAQDPNAQPQEQIPPPLSGAITNPPGANLKTAAMLTKQAMAYVKSGRPAAKAVLSDLRNAASLERIKQATAQREKGYPEENPYGDLIRLKQKISMLCNEANYAAGSNKLMVKEAEYRFIKAVAQHILNDGSLGEVAQVLEYTPGDEHLKLAAIKSAMDYLVQRGLDLDKARAEAIKYQMEKGAQVRVANAKHPIVATYLDFQKIASNQVILDEGLQSLKDYEVEIDSTMKEVVRHVTSRQ